ncbi:hypothetical protein, partial [Klebsiella quasipneumoniae]|uniref:hypothetical protein n=1 Tax=Klebsiella quasipneumoniae TaxID=1463165 RepID=UPI001B34E4C6
SNALSNCVSSSVILLYSRTSFTAFRFPLPAVQPASAFIPSGSAGGRVADKSLSGRRRGEKTLQETI